MVKLVSVVRSDDYPYDRRQLPLVVDDTLTMVVQFSDDCVGCSQTSLKQQELERFVTRFNSLSSDEVAVALMVTSKDLLDLLSKLVTCVGCRKSVERLYHQLVSSGHPTIEPLIITPSSVLSIRREILFDPKAVYALLYMHGRKLDGVLECIPKSKKNKRCQIHSLDIHKVRSLSMWEEVWEMLSQECRDEVTLVKCSNLLETMDSYLRKHRFCADCKSKVQHAYKLLVKEVDHKNEKGYCAQLYNGIRCCKAEGHLHLDRDTEYIRKLVERAEPELQGSRRERHAKTLDIAQEEVLTCLGIHLYDRLHRIGQKVRAEEQTWLLLFSLGIHALRKNFEVAMEKKQGISNLELVCEEFAQLERAKEEKLRQKKLKKRKNKKTKKLQENNDKKEEDEEEDNCECDENTNMRDVSCNSCDHLHSAAAPPPRCTFELPTASSSRRSPETGGGGGGGGGSCRSDCGYSSEGGDLSSPSSREGSDVACSEGICNHDGDTMLCRSGTEECEDCAGSDLSHGSSPKHWNKQTNSQVPGCRSKSPGQGCSDSGGGPGGCSGSSWNSWAEGRGGLHSLGCSGPCSLLAMLESNECGAEGCEDEAIPQEDIEQYRENKSLVMHQRAALRQRLRARFHTMQQQQNNNHTKP